jgi:hypothetical protein
LLCVTFNWSKNFYIFLFLDDNYLSLNIAFCFFFLLLLAWLYTTNSFFVSVRSGSLLFFSFSSFFLHVTNTFFFAFTVRAVREQVCLSSKINILPCIRSHDSAFWDEERKKDEKTNNKKVYKYCCWCNRYFIYSSVFHSYLLTSFTSYTLKVMLSCHSLFFLWW